MTELKRKWDTELMKCPDCDVALHSNHIEFVGIETAERDVYCPNSDCTFGATEMWKIAKTEEYETTE